MIEINRNPSSRELRVFGCAGLVVTAALGVWIMVRHHVFGIGMSANTAQWIAIALWCLGAGAGVLALVAPAWLRGPFIGLSLIAWPIGWVVGHVVAAIIYFGVITPIGLVFHVMGRDLLERRIDPDATTYWRERPASTDVKRYFRQF